ncbi:ubiquinone biosynthesis protein COQ7-domain-containing protein [Tricharina praecox]|uniref:ubiquinone biosynthesis protein COQ7-domain-containing protein n=1 Tax=Tricharina praecox TaxID=43433 RepID=UPI00221EE2AF|nr:ubiquinone biosynthesis protein COQ7-domain-containing protein [Tricharina praecox]KAI5851898.1 ubiquinone biosynthesis protein COQ7-domain-containing protein [Tricharina praecox]
MSLRILTHAPALGISRIAATTTTRKLTTAAAAHTQPTSSPAPAPPQRPLTAKETAFLEKALRVNQAGELGANLIYAGQYAIFKRDAKLAPLIRHMWDQEVEHLDKFDSLLAKHRVRPTALRPLWNVAGYALGLGTALLGPKAAMACTEAVETEIGGHYNNQLRVLLDMCKDEPELLKNGEIKELVDTIRKFRDDELEHLDTAVEHDAKGAEGYEVLHNLIRGGCKAAIYVSERI